MRKLSRRSKRDEEEENDRAVTGREDKDEAEEEEDGDGEQANDAASIVRARKFRFGSLFATESALLEAELVKLW